MNFIDLFSGLGGFNVALSELGHKCVFSSEINPYLRELYKENFNIDINGDIRKISVLDIPKHDILCAGFPCQPFSHAGKQNGLTCDKNGNLFFEIVRILHHHRPKYFILENVANLKYHDKGNTWLIIKGELQKLGYNVLEKILSPHEFGIPHHRKRIFIIGSLNKLDYYKWPQFNSSKEININDILDKNPSDAKYLTKKEIEILDLWQDFLDIFSQESKLPSFPIWSMEFGADYPIRESNPNLMSQEQLSKFKGSFGIPLSGMNKDEQIKNLPTYASFSKHINKYPAWKIRFIEQNRNFYKDNKELLDKLIPRLKTFANSFQKFERNCQGEERNIYKHIIQFRGSGVRIKSIKSSPSLIYSTTSQIPIIGFEKRYLTKKEASRLQSLQNIKMPLSNNLAFSALGNSLNSHLVKLIAQNLIK